MRGAKLALRLGIFLIAVGIIAGLVIALADVFDSDPGATTGIVAGGVTAATLLAFGIPVYRYGRRLVREREAIVNSGQRIRAVVTAVYEQDQSHLSDQGFIYIQVIEARGPGPTGPNHLYKEGFDVKEVSVRPGDSITIALHPTDPTKFAMLIGEEAKHFQRGTLG